MGGDYDGRNHPGLREKQWNHRDRPSRRRRGRRHHGHSSRTRSAYSGWADLPGFNLNNIYTDGTEYDDAAVEYARPGPLPFFLIEGHYDGESATDADCRRQAYATVLSGGCGHLFGNNPIWGFGEPLGNGGGARPMRSPRA